jgi:isopenicillin-N epimerase
MPSYHSCRNHWSLPPDVTYLNHGSFGPTPLVVQRARQQWSEQLAAEPMDFFIRRMEDHLDEAAMWLGNFIGCDEAICCSVENATVGTNIAAKHIIAARDEVLVTDHEYCAVAL